MFFGVVAFLCSFACFSTFPLEQLCEELVYGAYVPVSQYLFVFFLVSFAVQNLFSLMRSHGFIFALISIPLLLTSATHRKALLAHSDVSILVTFSSSSP